MPQQPSLIDLGAHLDIRMSQVNRPHPAGRRVLNAALALAVARFTSPA